MSVDCDHGAVPLWFVDFSSSAYPACADAQTFSMMLPSISIRRACLVSMIVLVIHTPLHEAGRVNRLRIIVMSDGDRLAIEGSAPPNITAWWPPSTWLFLMR